MSSEVVFGKFSYPMFYREVNYTADYLINLGHSLDLGCHLFSEPNVCVIGWLRYDLVGVSQFRLINNTYGFTCFPKKKNTHTHKFCIEQFVNGVVQC
ncbi:hypothetical protein LINPERHAP1_LOCUS20149 [Linum perenne]